MVDGPNPAQPPPTKLEVKLGAQIDLPAWTGPLSRIGSGKACREWQRQQRESKCEEDRPTGEDSEDSPAMQSRRSSRRSNVTIRRERRGSFGRLIGSGAGAGLAGELRALHAALCTPFDPNGVDEHEQLLRKLWGALVGSEQPFARKSETWKELGFQGADPATDVRGGGLLAVQCLCHFGVRHASGLRHMLVQLDEAVAARSDRFYPVSTTAIVICSRLCDALRLSNGMRGAVEPEALERRLRETSPAREAPLAKLLVLHWSRRAPRATLLERALLGPCPELCKAQGGHGLFMALEAWVGRRRAFCTEISYWTGSQARRFPVALLARAG